MAKRGPKKPAKRKLKVKKGPIADLAPRKKDPKGGWISIDGKLTTVAPPYVPVMPRF